MHVYIIVLVVVFWCESDRHRPTLDTCLPWCAWPSSWPGRPCWAAGEARRTSRCPSRAGSSRWRGSRPLCGQIISQERHPPLIFNISIESSENPSIELVHCNWLLNYWIDIIYYLYDASMLLTMPRTSLAGGSTANMCTDADRGTWIKLTLIWFDCLTCPTCTINMTQWHSDQVTE